MNTSNKENEMKGYFLILVAICTIATGCSSEGGDYKLIHKITFKKNKDYGEVCIHLNEYASTNKLYKECQRLTLIEFENLTSKYKESTIDSIKQGE